MIVNHAAIQRWVYKFTLFIVSEMKKKGRVGLSRRPISKYMVFVGIYFKLSIN